MFNHNKLLKEIDLAHNRIYEFNLNLNIFPKLDTLYLDYNLLKVLDKLLFKEFIMKSTHLIITNNNFICDCDMYWLASMNSDFNSTVYTKNNICKSSKLKNTSLECFITNKIGSGDCTNITLPTCSQS